MSDEPQRMKSYSIKSRWFDWERFEAVSTGKAKMTAYRATQEAIGRSIKFKDFLNGLSILHHGPVATPKEPTP